MSLASRFCRSPEHTSSEASKRQSATEGGGEKMFRGSAAYDLVFSSSLLAGTLSNFKPKSRPSSSRWISKLTLTGATVLAGSIGTLRTERQGSSLKEGGCW